MVRNPGLTLPEELQKAMIKGSDKFYEELDYDYGKTDDISVTFNFAHIPEDLGGTDPNLKDVSDKYSAYGIILEFLRLRQHLGNASISSRKLL